MSTFVPVTVRCSRCGHRFPAEAATGLHVSRSPEIRERILAGDFHRVDCPRCDHANLLQDRTFVYTDFDRGHWITVYPEDGLRYRGDLVRQATESHDAVLRDQCPTWVTTLWGEHFVQRVVFGMNRLREKLLVLDAGLDDRLLEAFKLQLLRDLRLGPFSPRTDLLFERLDPDELVLSHLGAPGVDGHRVVRVIGVPRARWEDLTARPEAALAATRATEAMFGGPLTDWRVLGVADEPLPERFRHGVDLPDPPLR